MINNPKQAILLLIGLIFELAGAVFFIMPNLEGKKYPLKEIRKRNIIGFIHLMIGFVFQILSYFY